MNESDIAKEAGKRLRAARILNGLSRADVCIKIGWEGVKPETRLGNYENGYRMIGVLEALALAKVYGVRPGYLLGIDEKETNPLLEKLIAESINLSEQQLTALVSNAQAMQPTTDRSVTTENITGNDVDRTVLPKRTRLSRSKQGEITNEKSI